MKIKKLSLYSCMIVLSISLIGCATKRPFTPPAQTTTETTVTTANVETPTATEDLIKISKITNKTNGSNTDIIGSMTNNNKVEVRFIAKLIYLNADGTPITTVDIYMDEFKAGETRFWDDSIIGMDINKATYKFQIESFTSN